MIHNALETARSSPSTIPHEGVIDEIMFLDPGKSADKKKTGSTREVDSAGKE